MRKKVIQVLVVIVIVIVGLLSLMNGINNYKMKKEDELHRKANDIDMEITIEPEFDITDVTSITDSSTIKFKVELPATSDFDYYYEIKNPVSLLVEEDSKSSKWKKVENNTIKEQANLIRSFDRQRGVSAKLDNWFSLGNVYILKRGSEPIKQNVMLSLDITGKLSMAESDWNNISKAIYRITADMNTDTISLNEIKENENGGVSCYRLEGIIYTEASIIDTQFVADREDIYRQKFEGHNYTANTEKYDASLYHIDTYFLENKTRLKFIIASSGYYYDIDYPVDTQGKKRTSSTKSEAMKLAETSLTKKLDKYFQNEHAHSFDEQQVTIYSGFSLYDQTKKYEEQTNPFEFHSYETFQIVKNPTDKETISQNQTSKANDDSDVSQNIHNLSSKELDERIFSAYKQYNTAVTDDSSHLVKGEFSGDTYIATIYFANYINGKTGQNRVANVTVQENGDYTIESTNAPRYEGGNIFTRASEGDTGKVKRNASEKIIPKLSLQEFSDLMQENMKEISSGIKESYEETDYLICTLLTPPHTDYRLNKKTGVVESSVSGYEYHYDSKATTAISNYWNQKDATSYK